MRLAPQTRDELSQEIVRIRFVVAVCVEHQQRVAGRVPSKMVQELRARIVGPLEVVDADDYRTPAGERFEELRDGAKQPPLARLREIRRQNRNRDALPDRWHERGDLSERHRRQLPQRGRRRQLEQLSHEIDHRLVRYRALDLIAVRRERPQTLRPRGTRHLAHQTAFADPGLALDQGRVSAARHLG